MKLRTAPVTIAAAAAALVPLASLVPAYADVAAPGLTVESGVAGTVSGTVSSVDQPYVLVQLVGASDTVLPGGTAVKLADGDTYSFTSWGYGSGTTVQAWACPTDTYVQADCSATAVSDAFTPSDIALTPTWSSDTTVGPSDQVSLDLGNPGDLGGGSLFGQWSDDGPAPQQAPFAVAHSGSTLVPVRDGVGAVQLLRCDNANRDHCVEEGVSPSSYEVRTSMSASVSGLGAVSSANPTTTFDVATGRSGSYTVSWHLENTTSPGVAVSGYGGTHPGTLVGGVAQAVPLDAAGLPAGTYDLVGTITVVDPDFGTFADVPLTGATTLTSTGDITPPTVTAITSSKATIYPRVGISGYPASTTVKVVSTSADTDSIVIRTGSGKAIRHLDTPVGTATVSAVWNGRNDAGTLVPAGTYYALASDAAGNLSAKKAAIKVDARKLVLKTWTHTYSPAGTLADKYIGKCSTLRKPSLRGWTYSLGYYANTRCASQTSKDSLVSTLHAVFLPTAVQYLDLHVTAYGGAAKAQPHSKAVIRYLTTSGDWANEKTLSATMGYHAGTTRTATGLVFKDHSVGWGLYTGFGYRYDVKSFTVVLHYKVLG